MKNVANFFVKCYWVIRKASQTFSVVAEIALAFVMLLTACDVILRYVFNMPIAGAYELTEYAMAVVIGGGIAYCGVLKGHVDVDVLVNKLPPKTQAVIACFTGLLSTILFAFITYNTFLTMRNYVGLRLNSAALQIPLYPFVGIAGLGCALLTLVILAGLIESIYKVSKR